MQKIMISEKTQVELDDMTREEVMKLFDDYESKYNSVKLVYGYFPESCDGAYEVYVQYERLETDEEFQQRLELNGKPEK